MFRLNQVKNVPSLGRRKGNLTCVRLPTGVSSRCSNQRRYPMQYTILEVYRHNLYHECFTRAADALFDLADALLTDVSARSLIELSDASCFRRGWPSLYAALEDGLIDRAALLRVFLEMLPQRLVGTR